VPDGGAKLLKSIALSTSGRRAAGCHSRIGGRNVRRMTTESGSSPDRRDPAPLGVPPTDRRKIVIASVLLAIPVIALMWVASYNRETPKLGPFPFFFWYQFAWVFLCSALTYTAYRLVLSARPARRQDLRGGQGRDEERTGS
jgi:hypothetical protein